MKAISFQTDILPLKNELFRLALRITQNRFEAEDVVQETMLKVWKGRSEWDKIDNIEAYCLTVCRLSRKVSLQTKAIPLTRKSRLFSTTACNWFAS